MSTDTRTRIILKNLAPLREQAEPYDDWRRLDREAAVAAHRIRDFELPGRNSDAKR
ncbi:hypothetical protein [Saccharopolyspora flava]|uniref:Uncharacterized protein n=1 Tax=Saccharopolyspora flava TaxID=95161 RepID=A0A1I6S698_9PSEU|nr:hypothetical protein [Saccharopolyspora flava]SFS72461.1 hypothetical protein SAMN05660874_02926 [Saccharopolyspora flava]